MSDKIILDNFTDLLEVVSIQNFDNKTAKLSKEPKFKKAIKVGNAPKKAVLINKAPPKKIKKGGRFTPRKVKSHGRMIHFTNVKNSFKRGQKHKSRKNRGGN